jgi:hypothetical protein
LAIFLPTLQRDLLQLILFLTCQYNDSSIHVNESLALTLIADENLAKEKKEDRLVGKIRKVSISTKTLP